MEAILFCCCSMCICFGMECVSGEAEPIFGESRLKYIYLYMWIFEYASYGTMQRIFECKVAGAVSLFGRR
jgi:hypothetical protein